LVKFRIGTSAWARERAMIIGAFEAGDDAQAGRLARARETRNVKNVRRHLEIDPSTAGTSP
jgi:hypothetical protein